MISSFFFDCAGSRIQPKAAGVKKAVREKMLAPPVGSKKVDPASSLPPEARLLAKPQVQVCIHFFCSLPQLVQNPHWDSLSLFRKRVPGPVLRIRIWDPVPCGSGMGKKSESGSGINNPAHIS